MSKNLIESLLAAAKDLTPLIVPGAAPAIAAAKGLIDVLKSAKEIGDPTPVEQAFLDKSVSDLQTTVSAMVADESKALRG